MIEYSILIGLITAVTIGLILAMGAFVTGAWSALCTATGTISGFGCVMP